MKMKISSGVCYAKYHFSKTDNFTVSVEEFVAKNSISAEQFFSIYGEIYQYFIFKSVFNDKTLLVKQKYKCVCVLAAWI